MPIFTTIATVNFSWNEL